MPKFTLVGALSKEVERKKESSRQQEVSYYFRSLRL